MQERAKPSPAAPSPRRQREDYDIQHAKAQKDQTLAGKKPTKTESGILRELAEEQRHLD